jgi:hypothetical protein
MLNVRSHVKPGWMLSNDAARVRERPSRRLACKPETTISFWVATVCSEVTLGDIEKQGSWQGSIDEAAGKGRFSAPRVDTVVSTWDRGMSYEALRRRRIPTLSAARATR